MHGGAEIIESSTNKQHHLSFPTEDRDLERRQAGVLALHLQHLAEFMLVCLTSDRGRSIHCPYSASAARAPRPAAAL